MIRTHEDPREEVMKTPATAIRGYHMPSDHRTWETVGGWTKRMLTRENLTVGAISAIGLLLCGLMIWAFYQSIEASTTAGLPLGMTFYAF